MQTPGYTQNHEHHERQILNWIEDRRPLTQRRLASDLGIALGLTNLLVRRLIKKGWIRARRVSPRGVRYMVTPAGMVAKARLTRAYFLHSLEFYRESRERMRERLGALDVEAVHASAGGSSFPVVFYGASEVAEIAYVCLQETNLHLLGVVDASASRRFFHFAVHSPARLSGRTLDGQPFVKLVVMPLQDEAEVRAHLEARQVPSDVVFWL